MRINTILVGITISLLLLALPATASDYTLDIFGNANEDDRINMQDVTYTERIILEYSDRTQLADGKYDGRINMQDVTQIELIILGREKELTLIDGADRVVTVPRPIERVVSTSPECIRIMMALGELEKLVAKPFHSTRFIFDMYPTVFPESEGLPIVSEDNPEFILSVEPDVVFMYSPTPDRGNDLQEKTGLPVLSHPWIPTWDSTFATMKLVGTVLGNEEEVEDLISYCNEKFDEVAEVTSQIDDSEKPTVFFISRIEGSSILTHAKYDTVGMAGGILVTENLPGESPQPGGSIWVSVEDFIAWDPDIILVSRSGETPGTPVDDILSDSRFQTMDAVVNHKVYYTISGFTYWMNDHPRALTELFIMAKIFYPDEFEDLDLEAEGNEIFERFYGVDGYWTELGTKCGYI